MRVLLVDYRCEGCAATHEVVRLVAGRRQHRVPRVRGCWPDDDSASAACSASDRARAAKERLDRERATKAPLDAPARRRLQDHLHGHGHDHVAHPHDTDHHHDLDDDHHHAHEATRKEPDP